MFASRPDGHPSPATTLTPGPDHWNVFHPDDHRQPPTSLKKAVALAHQLARAYVLWDGQIYVVVTPHQHLATNLTAADIRRLPPAPGTPGYVAAGE
jgi:hypothetical protein